ncbi:hypothetical protein GW17_00056771 [Ensete ventricosum]|nr:hypothetical protein GW17_00056771 [Ensete ventricosum]
MGTHREIVRSSPKVSEACRELAEGDWELVENALKFGHRASGRGSDDIVGTGREIAGSSPKVLGVCREFAESSPKVSRAYREFAEGDRELAESTSGVRQKMTETH